MANLETKAPARTFKDLLNVHDGDNNEGIEAGLKVVQDGEGVASALSLSQTEAKVDGSLTVDDHLDADSIMASSLTVDDHLDADSIETQGDLTVGGELEAQGAYFHGGIETTTFEAENVATLGDGSKLKTDAAPTADAEIANKKYVDDNAGGSATSLSTGTITATTYGITSDGGADDVVLAEADTNNSGVLGSAKWDEIVANTAHSGGDGSDHADVATNTSHSGGDGSDHADVATNTTHSSGNGSDHADVATNTTHSGGDGSDHADVATNTSHSGGDGSDHADVATNTAKVTCNTTNVKSALNASLGGAANIGDASDTVTIPGKGDATGNFRVLTASPGVWPTSGQGMELMVNNGTGYIANGTRDGSNITAYHPIRIDGSEIELRIEGTDKFTMYDSGLAAFKDDVIIEGDLEVDGGYVKVDDKIIKTPPGFTGYDVSDINATFREDIGSEVTDATYDINLDTFNGGFLWNDDGTKFWIPCKIPTLVAGGSVEKMGLFSYTCTTPYDWSTKVVGTLEALIDDGFPASFGNSRILGVEWNDDGSWFYLMTEHEHTETYISRYETDAPYTILTSPGGAQNTFAIASGSHDILLSENDQSAGFSVHTRVDGNDGYIFAGQNDITGTIARWEMTGDGIDSGNPQQTVSVPNAAGNGKVAVRVYDSGTKMMIYGNNGQVGGVYYGWKRYSLSVAYDLTSTITLLEAVNYDSRSWKMDGYGFDWSPDGGRFYGTGNGGMWNEHWLVQHTLFEPEHYLDLTTTVPTIGPGLQVEGDLVVSGSITSGESGGNYAHSFWSHNFVDAIGSSEHRIPWADTSELATGTGRQGFLAPYDMEFVSFHIRYENITTSHNMELRVYHHNQGDEDDQGIGYYSFAVTDAQDDYSFSVSADDLAMTADIDAGDLVYLTIKADVAPTGSSQDWFITSHWIMDLDSTYTTGNV